MQRVIHNKDFLRKLARAKSPLVRHQLLITATTDEILTVVEICVNILKFRFPLRSKQRKRLATHAEILRKLSRVRTENSARKILQKGEGPLFASLLIPVLAEVASHIISSLRK